MNRTQTYSGNEKQERDRGGAMKDLDTWLGNSLATILAGLAVAAGVIGMLVAFGYVNEDSTAPFEDGLVWMIGGIILAIAGNVFRREHHVVDADFSRQMRPQPLQGGSESLGYNPKDVRHEDMRTGSGTLDDDIRERSSGIDTSRSRMDDDYDEIRGNEGRPR